MIDKNPTYLCRVQETVLGLLFEFLVSKNMTTLEMKTRSREDSSERNAEEIFWAAKNRKEIANEAEQWSKFYQRERYLVIWRTFEYQARYPSLWTPNHSHASRTVSAVHMFGETLRPSFPWRRIAAPKVGGSIGWSLFFSKLSTPLSAMATKRILDSSLEICGSPLPARALILQCYLLQRSIWEDQLRFSERSTLRKHEPKTYSPPVVHLDRRKNANARSQNCFPFVLNLMIFKFNMTQPEQRKWYRTMRNSLHSAILNHQSSKKMYFSSSVRKLIGSQNFSTEADSDGLFLPQNYGLRM